jgi:hypothetical protein
MEVHHSHHPTHKKNLKEYFTEFIMLFTAVTLGFFAENLREVYIEKERSHEFVERFEVDLKNNVYFLDSLLKFDHGIEYVVGGALIELIKSKDSYNLNLFYDKVSAASPRFLSKNDTYEQMKSSGALRYIKDSKLQEMMVDYTNEAEAAEYRSNSQEAVFSQGEFAKVFDKWMPQDIAVRSYLNRFEQQKSQVPSPDSVNILLKNIENFKEPKPYIIKGAALKLFKDEIIPAVTRKLRLMKTTMGNLQRAKIKGEKLLEYLDKNH